MPWMWEIPSQGLGSRTEQKGEKRKLEDSMYPFPSPPPSPDLLGCEQAIHTLNTVEAPAAMMDSVPSSCESQ